MAKPFYITTPIYYPNGEPHLGHSYTTIASDAIARFHRLQGEPTFFLTGTDEHGIKMVKTAASLNIEPRVLADQMVVVFADFWKEIKISNDDCQAIAIRSAISAGNWHKWAGEHCTLEQRALSCCCI